MSKFIYKQTNDGIYHIYLDDPSKEGFTKVAQAKKISIIKENNHKYMLLFNDESFEKKLLGIIENKIFQVTIPKDAKVTIFDNICMYEKNESGIWYTMLLKNDVFEELKLGVKHEVFLGCPANIKYKTLYWCFFTQKLDQYKELHSIINQKVVNLGKYLSIENNCNGEIFAMCENGDYDIFTPTSPAPKQGTPYEILQTLDHLFIWNDKEKHWRAYKGSILAKNAVYDVVTCGDKRKILLYELKDGTLELVKESYNYQFVPMPFSIIIDNLLYFQDCESGLVDFDNPKRTFKKRFKDIFK